MDEVNEHLTLEEIVWLARGGSEPAADGVFRKKLRDHLAGCPECARASEDYRIIMPKLDLFNRTGRPLSEDDCPHASVWARLAAGILDHGESLQYARHAAGCSSCAAELKAALAIIGDPAPLDPQLEARLKTGTQAWQKGFAREMAARSRDSMRDSMREAGSANPKPAARRFRLFTLPVPAWSYAAASLAVAGVLGSVWFLRAGPPSPQELLAQAYGEQRTLELRIQGAHHGPLSVERGGVRIAPPALYDAQSAAAHGLEKNHNDLNLLRAQADADLLTGNDPAALDKLEQVRLNRPNDPHVLTDLANAYFERGKKRDDGAPDFSKAKELLNRALAISPNDPEILFNLAKVDGRLLLYNQSIEDWKRALQVEKDPEWRKEDQRELDEAERKLEELQRDGRGSLRGGSRDGPRPWTPDQLQAADPEQSLKHMEDSILPQISHPSPQDQNFQAASLLAQDMSRDHADSFLKDLLRASGRPGFHEASLSLSRASRANAASDFEGAYAAAGRSADFFRRMGSPAGLLVSQFEKAYALQFESHPDECRAVASAVEAGALRRHYLWLQIQAGLEQAICSNIKGDLGAAKEMAQRATRLAALHQYHGYFLRGLYLMGLLEAEAGNDSKAWQDVQQGIQLYRQYQVSPLRAYNLYNLVDRLAEHQGQWNVQLAAIQEALHYIEHGPDQVTEALERFHLANVALRLNQDDIAKDQFTRIEKLLSSAPRGESLQWRTLQVKVGLAQVESHGGRQQELSATLRSYLPEIRRLSNRYVDDPFYTTLGDLEMRAGHQDIAEQFLSTALLMADKSVPSLATWRERLTLMEQHRQAYLLTADLLAKSGRPGGALKVWEHFQSASPQPLTNDVFARDVFAAKATKTPDASRSPAIAHTSGSPDGEAGILTYAFAADHLILWFHHGRELHWVTAPLTPSDFTRLAETFLEECARPDSDLSNLDANARTLYRWLIEPVRPWLPASGHLIIEPDGILGMLPFEAFIGPSGQYLGEQYSITLSPTVIATEGGGGGPVAGRGARALIVAAPLNQEGSLDAPPGAVEEAQRVAANFVSSTLAGEKATLSAVKREISRNSIFHFAGHAASDRNGAEMILADGNLNLQPQGGRMDLHHLGLAVFSACGTAKPSEVSQSDSLVTAFLQAGAANVVASRWNVDSESTRDFMQLFYQSLLSGASVAEALRSAGQTFRANPERMRPYYWAAFSAFGRS